jgi:hypothetical protein
VLSRLGGVFAGLVSTGVGEATLPAFTVRSRFPVPVAAATSTALQGRVPARAAQAFFAGRFALIGVVFVAVFGFGVGARLMAGG